jgi:putative flippase GtrA
VAFDQVVLIKFIRFCLVGFSGMVIDFGTTWLLKEKVRINKYIANSTGFILAATSNYFLNRIWTFHSHNQQIITEYSSFILISLAGLAINNFVIFILHGRLKMNFYFSKLIAVLIVTCWNFVLNYLITFSGKI